MKITVLVPTYKRVPDLRRCLEALKNQERPAEEIILVARDTDAETWEFLKTYRREGLPLRTATVCAPGQVQALNAGKAVATGDILAITDDDGAPRPDWLAKIEAYFQSDDRIGGVGGRDWVYHGDKLEEGANPIVGKVLWYGKWIGNHHIGVGGPREVEMLKGVNMSYRMAAVADIAFDERLRGNGAQIRNDTGFGLRVVKAGWKLLYDPAVAVNHYPAVRHDEDQRAQFSGIALTNIVHNDTLLLLEYLSWAGRPAFLAWALLIGRSDMPGLLQLPRLLAKRDAHAFPRYAATLTGRLAGLKSYLRYRKAV